ncbi:uncharacterized protein [Parasteatoda tepidariorum]|uniref:uncharacterized protein n=1 Tax=Parasteatoda tepidariorum TaxID=114398 RepID=UPI00077F89D2|nr:uncharacterized protein LOC107453931 [Parasteatoda tepidariorum]XP_015926438.1 uncharacterized protein LOC107453931 [Parasteatoda tepidariorum]XP_015926439.1 uncharacterized protein LOC107453931 [Parasteatoda tepidariorum]
MDGNSFYNGYRAQPPKKRKSGADYEEREMKPDLGNLNVSTPPKSNSSQSQDSPLDFSVKNGNDSFTPPSVISPPSTISPPSARSASSSPSATSSPISPPTNSFPNSDFEMRGKNTAVRMSHNTRDHVVDCSESGPRLSPETFNPCRPKVSVVNPTVHMHNDETTNGHKETPVPNLPLPSFGKFVQSPRNSYDVPINAGNSEIGFGNIGSVPKEYRSHSKKYESVVNGFGQSIPNEGLCSANISSYNPYLGMLPGSFGAGLINGQGGILTPQGGLLGGQSGLLSSQVGLLNGQGGLLGGQGGLLNGHAYKYGSTETNGDRKVSKAARPFKIYEQEILNYPFQNCPTMIPPRFQEVPQQPTTTYNPTESSRNESPTHQQSNSSSRLSNASIEVQRDASDCFSDESQHSNNPQQGSEGNSARRKGQKYPDEKKDAAYFEKRRKNNLAAKRSRDARRLKEDAIATRARNLVQENTLLRMKLAEFQTINLRLEAELSGFKRAAYDQRSEIDKLKDEVERLSRGFAFNNGSRTCDRSESPSL